MAPVETIQPGIAVLRHEGELTSATSPVFSLQLGEALAAQHRLIVVDMSAASFVDSSGLGALIAGLKQARAVGIRLVLAGLQEQAALIFRVTTAHKLFEIFPSVEAALEGREA